MTEQAQNLDENEMDDETQHKTWMKSRWMNRHKTWMKHNWMNRHETWMKRSWLTEHNTKLQ